jgi:hypothetical protein
MHSRSARKAGPRLFMKGDYSTAEIADGAELRFDELSRSLRALGDRRGHGLYGRGATPVSHLKARLAAIAAATAESHDTTDGSVRENAFGFTCAGYTTRFGKSCLWRV